MDDRHQAEASAQGAVPPESSRELARRIALNSSDVILHTREGVIVWVSPSVTDVSGWLPSGLVGRRLEELVHPDDKADLLVTEVSGTVRRRRRMLHQDGSYVWMEGQSRPFVTADEQVDGVLSIVRSVDAEQRALDRAAMERDLLRAALQSMLDAYSLLEAVRDSEGRVVDFAYVDVNEAAQAHYGVTREEMLASTLLNRLPGRRHSLFDTYVRTMETGEPIIIDDYPDPDAPEGQPRFLDIRGIRVGNAISFTMRDVTERWRAREALRARAELDELTGLVNRGEVLRRLDRMAAHPARAGVGTAIAFCDVDGFKAVNDSLGHVVGDEVLRAVGRRMADALRESDVIARFGGDEFLIVLEGVDDVEAARLVVDQMRAAVLEPLLIDGTEVRVGLSVGVVMLDRNHSVSRHISEADRAMFAAKRAGGGVVTGVVAASEPSSPAPERA